MPLRRAVPRHRLRHALLVPCVIAAGLATRAFPSLLPSVLGKYPGDALWAVMIFVGLGAIFPALSTLALGGLALAICFAVETAKLCPFAWLTALRHTTLGHLVLGRAFTWQNFFAYSAGVAVAIGSEWLVVRFTAIYRSGRN